MSFKDKCKEAGIKYDTAKKYRQAHRDMTDEQIIEYFKSKNKMNKGMTLGDKCYIYGLDVQTVTSVKNMHDLTDEQAIEYVLNNKTYT